MKVEEPKQHEVKQLLPVETEDIIKTKQLLEDISGIYFLIEHNEVVYVGQSTNIMLRVYTHAQEKRFDSFSYIPIDPSNHNIIEALYIWTLQPRHNRTVPNVHRVTLSNDQVVYQARGCSFGPSHKKHKEAG